LKELDAEWEFPGPAPMKLAVDELAKDPVVPFGLAKPLSVSVIDRLVLPEPPAGMKTPPFSWSSPLVEFPEKLLLPPNAAN